VTDDDPFGLVPVTAVQQRLRDLNRSGMTYTEISQITGYNRRYLHQLLSATTRWCALSVQVKIFKIKMPTQPVLVEWMDHAACKGEPVDLFFPQDRAGRPAHRQPDKTKPARQICTTCGVQAECLEYALRHNTVGIWAGTDERERYRMRKG